MAVGHIESIYLRIEKTGDAVDDGIVANDPESVDKFILIRKTVLRLACDGRLNDGSEFLVVFICEEDGLDVGILDAHMHHPVIFLVFAREFVLLDDALGVVVRMGTEDETVLRTHAHRLGIDIIAGLVVLHEPSPLFPQLEILHRLVIDGPGMFIGNRLEINLRAGNVQQTFFSGHLLGLQGVHHIVGRSRHFGHNFFRRTDRRKRFHTYHNSNDTDFRSAKL